VVEGKLGNPEDVDALEERLAGGEGGVGRMTIGIVSAKTVVASRLIRLLSEARALVPAPAPVPSVVAAPVSALAPVRALAPAETPAWVPMPPKARIPTTTRARLGLLRLTDTDGLLAVT
jgi:hypothetical protein